MTQASPQRRRLRHRGPCASRLDGTCNPPRDFPMLLQLYKAKKLNLSDLITRRCPLEQINEAFAEMNRGEVARGIIAM